jgi:outer membrane protein assembly factor BamE (lipoprotein component of BamABCDE complex)
MFSIFRATSMSIIALLLVACSNVEVGRDFDMHALEMKIQRGVTTQNEVRTWLGAPTSEGVSVDTGGNSFDEWTYYFASGKLPSMSNAKVKVLQVKFDKEGIVRGYNWSVSNP